MGGDKAMAHVVCTKFSIMPPKTGPYPDPNLTLIEEVQDQADSQQPTL